MIVVTGTIAYDYIMDFPGSFSDHILPESIHNINLSFIVNQFAKRRGGTAGNVSYSLGLLKTQHLLFSYAGKDFTEYKARFEELNISLSGVVVDPSMYTATGFAMTDKTNNQIWGYYYGAASNIEKMDITTVASSSDFVLIGPSGATGSMRFVNQCIDKNIPYMFDPGFILTQVSNEDLTKGVTHAAIIIGNDYEINLMKTRVPNWDEISKTKVIITTLGEKGATISDKGTLTQIDPCLVQKVVDPTGAGDAWRSGFLAGQERKLPLTVCAQMGAVAAAFCIEQYGTQEHSYTVANFKQRYSKTYKDVLDL